MQKKNATEKPHSYSNRNKIHKGLYFVLERSLAENVQNLHFLVKHIVGTVFNISLILQVLFFFGARNI